MPLLFGTKFWNILASFNVFKCLQMCMSIVEGFLVYFTDGIYKGFQSLKSAAKAYPSPPIFDWDLSPSKYPLNLCCVKNIGIGYKPGLLRVVPSPALDRKFAHSPFWGKVFTRKKFSAPSLQPKDQRYLENFTPTRKSEIAIAVMYFSKSCFLKIFRTLEVISPPSVA